MNAIKKSNNYFDSPLISVPGFIFEQTWTFLCVRKCLTLTIIIILIQMWTVFSELRPLLGSGRVHGAPLKRCDFKPKSVCLMMRMN